MRILLDISLQQFFPLVWMPLNTLTIVMNVPIGKNDQVPEHSL